MSPEGLPVEACAVYTGLPRSIRADCAPESWSGRAATPYAGCVACLGSVSPTEWSQRTGGDDVDVGRGDDVVRMLAGSHVAFARVGDDRVHIGTGSFEFA
jgi:hypothetical protein